MLKELTLTNKPGQLTKAQQRVLGFLIACGGEATVREMQDGTGLSHNSIYMALRDNSIPGVQKSKYHTNTGAAQYFVDAQLMKQQMPTGFKQPNTILDSEEWAAVDPFIFGELSLTIDAKPANVDRLEELAKAALNLDPEDSYFWDKWAVAMQAAAILALRLRGSK